MLSWDLFREMEQLHREIDDVFRGAALGLPFSPSGQGVRNFPRINLREDDNHIYIEALVPGVDPQQIEINMLGNTLTLAGERQADDVQANNRTWHRRERVFGKFMRTIELPVQVDVEKAGAEFRNGLLHVTLPKAAAAKPRAIDIQGH
jgi:HSP20 family protein